MIKSFLKKNEIFYYINDIKNKCFSNLNYFFKDKNNLQFIRVPRTACSFCTRMFEKFKLNIDSNNHYVKPKYQSKKGYLISIRDPIDRFISAFYHVKHVQKIYFHKDFFYLYPEVDTLARNLKNNETKKYIRLSHHLHEGLSTFFKIEDIKRNPPIYIFEFSSLHKDIFFFLKNVNRINKNKLNQFLAIVTNSSPNKKKLSSIGKKNLKIFLREDYKVYNYLIKRKSKINLKFINKIEQL